MTKKQARQIIEENKENTAYYGGYTSIITGKTEFIALDSMYSFFRSKGMGKAETNCILAALTLSGAKFEGELTLDY